MLRPIVVLIVDDAADNREMFAEYLALEGIGSVNAENGAVGVSMARGCLPDLILMDLTMPVMGGLEAIAQLKADARTRDIPVVVLSGDGVLEHAKALSAGCSACLSKPCLPEDLAGVVSSIVALQRLSSAGNGRATARARRR